MTRAPRIGLTGGIASGKSTVAGMFGKLGAGIVDTDVAARDVVARGTPGLAAVRKAFGDSILDADGALDRRALRRIVFDDPRRRRRLERILHPLIRRRTLERLATLDAPYAIVVVPLLVETGFATLLDRVVVVDCPEETQIRRLISRDGLTRAEAESMLAAQASRSARLDAADDVIDGSDTRRAMAAQVDRLHRRYLQMASVCRAKPGRAE